MINLRSLIASILLAIVAASCATAPAADPQSESSAKQFTAPSDRGRLYVVRRGVVGTAVLFQVAINGRIVGSLPTRSFLAEDLTPGKYTISLFAPGNQENVDLAIQAGQTYFVNAELSKTSLATKANVKQVDQTTGQRLVAGASMVRSITSPADKKE